MAMKRRVLVPSLVGLSLLVSAVAACSDSATILPIVVDSGTDAPVSPGVDAGNDATALPDTGPTEEERTLTFRAQVGDKAFSCAGGPWTGLGTSAASADIVDFRLYVHDVKLIAQDGTEVPFALKQDGKWQYQNLALLDFEDKSGACANGTTETNVKLVGTAKVGTYKGVKFKLGVPFALNHADPAKAPSPLNITALFWAWNGGYKFARIDARVDVDGTPSPFLIHLGSTGCQGDPAIGETVTKCDQENRGEITLAGDPFAKPFLVDYKALVAASDLKVNGSGPPGCMSGMDDPECPALFPKLGVDATTHLPNAAQQALFRAE